MIMAITTCNAAQWSAFGETMAATFVRHWPREVRLTVYTEGFSVDPEEQFAGVDLDGAAPWLRLWKAAKTPAQCGMTSLGYKFRFDAARFAHKIAAIEAGARAFQDGILIWLDADIVSHSPITMDWLEALFPDGDLAWLDRDRTYPECGFLMFRLPGAWPIIDRLSDLYRSGSLFDLAEWHDSYAIQHVVKQAGREVSVRSLSGAGRSQHHVLVNSLVGDRLDHLKGDRKGIGRTPQHERVVAGGGSYWR